MRVQLLGEREVRSVVKLKFYDIMKNTVTCHRMMASTQKVGIKLALATAMHYCDHSVAPQVRAEDSRQFHGENKCCRRGTEIHQ